MRAGIAATAQPSDTPIAIEAQIEIDLARGHRLKITGHYDPETLTQLIRGCVSVIAVPSSTSIWLAAGITALRKRFNRLPAPSDRVPTEDPYCGQVFVFRGRRGDLIEAIWWSEP